MTLPMPDLLRRSLFQPKALGSKEPPKLLFHYTSTEGLLGILESKTLWATDFRYLNDPDEFAFARRLIVRELRKRVPHVVDSYDRHVYAVALELFEKLHTTAYVVSFSEDGNLLSQWRAYAPRNGFSVAFDSRSLQRIKDCKLVQCIYLSEETRVVSFDRFLESWISFRPSHFQEIREARAQGSKNLLKHGASLVARLMMNDLVGVALTVKHASYAEEREWRLVLIDDSVDRKIKTATSEVLHFRNSVFGLAPYKTLRLSVSASRGHSGVREVVVGPTPYPAAAVVATENLVRSRWPSPVYVRPCDIPYRS